MSDLLTLTPEGLYCPEAGVHIDPVRPVERAVITHGHADHARSGHGAVLATGQTLDIMAIRYGENFCGSAQAIGYGEALKLRDVEISLHPAGHVLGSAQVLLSSAGRRTVVSGDYKRQADPTCAPFEVVPCDTFVTEATFGLPVFRHPRRERRLPSCCRRWSCFRSRPIWSVPMRSARRNVFSQNCGRPVTKRRSTFTAHWRS